MIDKDIIEAIPQPMRSELRQAFALIAESGIVEQQIAREVARLAQGAADEPEGKLVERIREYRSRHTNLLTIQKLGESYQEQNDDTE